MSSERLWVLILTLTSFCAGLAGGVVVSAGRIPSEELGQFAQYEARMIETFGLDEARQRDLRYILQTYEEEIDKLMDRNVQDLEPELMREGQRRHDLIREWVVPPHRRQEFDTWTLGFRTEDRLE